VSSYATPADLITYGLPATALGSITPVQKQALLDNATAFVDSFLRGRYSLPLLAWGVEITEATCVIAAYRAIFGLRGGNPAAGSDTSLSDRYQQTLDWLAAVQRRAAHPNVTAAADNSPTYDQPVVFSTSVVTQGGRVASTRGW
jgi:phage gp36-like protein